MITEARGTMAVDITIVCKIMNDNHSRVDNIFIVLRRISSEKSDRDWFLSTTLKSMLTVLLSAIQLCYSSSDSVGKSLCFSQQSLLAQSFSYSCPLSVLHAAFDSCHALSYC